MLVRNSRLLQELEADVCRCATTGRFLSKPYAMSICIPDWETAKRSRPGLEHFLVAGMDYGNVDFNFQLFDGGPSNGRNHFLLVYDPNMIILFFFANSYKGFPIYPPSIPCRPTCTVKIAWHPLPGHKMRKKCCEESRDACQIKS